LIKMEENKGRYLDATIPSNCLFCGQGTYSKVSITPQITRLPFNEKHQQFAEYDLDYQNIHGIGRKESIRLPQGNIEGGSYKSFLSLKCDHCGNLQNFQLESDTSPWKNARPLIES